MLLILIVSLYTTRITLQVLGVVDYGIYQTVAGVVTFLAFVSNALGAGTSRFITYEMGKDKPRLSTLFATVRLAHIFLGIAIVLVGEIVGQWFILYRLIIPDGRIEVAFFAFHCAMLTTFFQITQVPYNALIIAYEKMNVYAYVGIVDALLKLLIVYLLQMTIGDKLEFYAILLCIATVLVMLIYRIYCRRNFPEVKSKWIFDKGMFYSIASFSSWSMITSMASSFSNQGITILTNMFFSPAIVTVRTLALTISNTINQFVGNFLTAVRPQIIKRYAAGDYEGSKKLVLTAAQYTYFLMLLIVLPLFLLIEPVLKIWLGNIPEGMIAFAQITLLQGLFQAFDASLFIAIYAKGQIRENAIINLCIDFGQFPFVYLLFSIGYPPIVLVWVETFCCVVLGVIAKPLLVKKLLRYRLSEIYYIIARCIGLTVLVAILPVISTIYVDYHSIAGFFAILLCSVLCTALGVWFLGIDKSMRIMVLERVKIWRKRID